MGFNTPFLYILTFKPSRRFHRQCLHTLTLKNHSFKTVTTLGCNCSSSSYIMSQDEREEYYRRKAIEIQKGIVNYKSCSTMTSESFIWTYRTTSVDVISVITTTVPVTNGAMKDILLKNREIKR